VSDVGPVTATWPPSPIDPPEPEVETALDQTLVVEQGPGFLTATDVLAIVIAAVIALTIWASIAFVLATSLTRWSQRASFAQCTDQALSVQARPADCMTYPGR
jgi:hypothetical protein